MASGKETPRQKMIGMMYLVLTALLALNVSREIINAFVVINEGLENTTVNFNQKNEQLYTDFDVAKSVDPVKVTPYWNKAQQVKMQTAALTSYIGELKKKLVQETENVTEPVADTLPLSRVDSKDNYDIPTHLLIGDKEDGSGGKANELKLRLEAYRDSLMQLVTEEDKKNIHLGINTDAPLNTEIKETWETYNFYHAPLAASLTILSKLMNDVKNAEYVMVDYLLKRFDSDIIKFDTISAKVIASSNYVLLGEKYKADVFIAAYNKTKNPEIYVGDYNASNHLFNGHTDTLSVEKGIGKYEFTTNKEGLVKWGGIVNVKTPRNQIVSFPFSSEFMVARPALTVSADNMNVFYLGLDNPVSISVPGIANDKLKSSITSGKLIPQGNGKFIARDFSGTQVKVAVSALLENGQYKSMGEVTFRLKPLPKPVAKIGEITEQGQMGVGEIIANKGLQCYYENFEFNAKPRVTSFKMVLTRNGMPIEEFASGSFLTVKMLDLLSKAKKGDIVEFENIKGMGPDNIPRQLAPLKIKVK